ncbi:carnitine dehydratase [Micractinium conductrix]|uniref:Carnitine dehydratase n=1 Tax=Micractinium conductrix TaxID=554055 RepID=A0A2P6V7H7_9CHLO|nr:carnitine dehydratase [Micractinium conductrix]|eukprot:PSC70037.1 carnitine dehydratase [Micractinium conductrix]
MLLAAQNSPLLRSLQPFAAAPALLAGLRAAATAQRQCAGFASLPADGAAAAAQPQPAAQGPLVGIKVLDLGQVVAGNFCGGLLAYFGADVIKVEPPGRGDALRHLRMDDGSGTSLWWRSYGRNRRCITIDLHNPEGRQLVRQLAARSDVLVENFRPGVMEKWELGPKDLKPDLVYTRISGYGQTGPRAHLPGYASVCEAFGGFRYINGYEDRAPVRPNISLGDSLAGLHAAFGTVMALLHRVRAGGGAAGQVVDAAITESMFNMLEGCVSEFGAHGAVRPPSGSTLTGVVPSGTWRAKDGGWVIIGGNGNSVYNRLMAAVGRADLGIENPRYATDAARCEHERDILEVIEAWVAAHTSDEVIAAMNEARVPAGRILSTADIVQDPQYQARGMIESATPPSGGARISMPAMLPVLEGTPGATRWAGPELGEHTEEVLRSELGLGDAEVQRLRDGGAI